jgi:hypothetical protein
LPEKWTEGWKNYGKTGEDGDFGKKKPKNLFVGLDTWREATA